MSKAELRKHAEALAENATDCIRAVLIKYNMGIIEGAVEERIKARNEALDDVLKILDDLHAKVEKPTPLEKGMRMAIVSVTDRVLAMKTSSNR